MSVFEAIVLGIVQGLTEFLPISSSGHLIIVPWLFNWEEPGLAFDAALHLGTLAAVFAYFWKDLLAMLLAVPRALRSPLALLKGEGDPESAQDRSARLALLLIVGSLPAGVAGLVFQNKIDDFFHAAAHEDRTIVLIAVMLIAFGLLLGWADRRAKHQRDLTHISMADAVAVGVAQAIALFPGVSRSGVTLTAGLLRNLKRADAARFSFLLGTPLVLAASLTGMKDLLDSGGSTVSTTEIVAGVLASAVSGFAAIWVLLKILQTSSTRVFVVYRVVVGIALILALVTGLR